MNILYVLVEFLAILKKKSKLENPQKICILFLRNLGIGDLIMLSPAIQEIANIFPQAEIDLVFWSDPIINLSGINIISLVEFEKNNKQYDLLISPTLNSRHLRFINRASHWFGYFAKTKTQSNFPIEKYSYDLKREHYLWRAIYLVKALNKEKGEYLEKQAIGKEIVYPELKAERPNYFDSLEQEKCLVLAPVSKFGDRQWPLKNISKVIQHLAMERKITKVVLLGDKSEHDRLFTNLLISDLLSNNQIFWKDVLVDMVGKNSLSESVYLIKNSYLFIGLDSAPSHIAYLTASKVLSIFVNIDPLMRLPLTRISGMVKQIFPLNSNFTIASGLIPPDLKKSQKLANSIKVEKVIAEINELIK